MVLPIASHTGWSDEKKSADTNLTLTKFKNKNYLNKNMKNLEFKNILIKKPSIFKQPFFFNHKPSIFLKNRCFSNKKTFNFLTNLYFWNPFFNNPFFYYNQILFRKFENFQKNSKISQKFRKFSKIIPKFFLTVIFLTNNFFEKKTSIFFVLMREGND